MDFLIFLEGLRNAFLDGLMLAVTFLGSVEAFMVAAVIMLWCVNKRQAYYVLSVGFVGTWICQFLKITFRIKRPWDLDPNFKAVEAAKSGANDYSFPSGHTMNSVGTFGAIATLTKKKLLKAMMITLCVIVPFSRMYLGVHTPLDVFTSVAIALLLIFILRPLILGHDGKYIPLIMWVMLAMSVVYLLFVELYPFPADIQQHNLDSAVENAYTLVGAVAGFVVVNIVDRKWVNYPVRAVWWAQLVKIVVGLALVMGVKAGLKMPLNALFGEMPGRAVRYFCIAVTAGILWPLTFKWFSKFEKRK